MSGSPRERIVVYGKAECVDTLRSRALLDGRCVVYTFVDVEASIAGRDEARRISGGATVPVIVLPGGSHLVEPSDEDLSAVLEALS